MAENQRKARLTRYALAVTITSIAAGAYFGYRLHQAERFNARVATGALNEAAQYPGPYGRFAQALEWHQHNRFHKALKEYGGLTKDAGALRTTARYNTGTLYLQWAMNTPPEDAARLRVPLLELAKETYRKLLLDDPGHWPARYNLERVLHLQPDPEELSPSAQGMPERSPRALGVIESARELP